MGRKRKIWKIVRRLFIAVLLVPIFVLSLAVAVLYIPSFQRKAISIAEKILQDRTGLEVSIERVGITPLANIDLHGILMLDQVRDTVLSAGDLVLKTDLRSISDGIAGIKRLGLHNLSIDSKDLIDNVSLKGSLAKFEIASDSTSFFDAYTIVNGITVKGVDLAIDLTRNNQDDTLSLDLPDSLSKGKSKGFPWKFDIREAQIEKTSVRLKPQDIDIDISHIKVSGDVDLDRKGYHAKNFESGPLNIGAGGKYYSLDEAYAVASMDSTHIRADELRLRKGNTRAELQAELDLNDIQSITYSGNIDIGWASIPEIVPIDIPLKIKGRLSVDGTGFALSESGTGIDITASIDTCSYGSFQAGHSKLTAGFHKKTLSARFNTSVDYSDTSYAASLSGDLDFISGDLLSRHPSVSLKAYLDSLSIRRDSLELNLDTLSLEAATSIGNTGIKAATSGFDINMESSLHLRDLIGSFERLVGTISEKSDSIYFDIPDIKKQYPEIKAGLNVARNHFAQNIISAYGISFDTLEVKASLSPETGIEAVLATKKIEIDTLSIHSADILVKQSENDDILCKADIDFLSQHGLPDINAGIDAIISREYSKAHLNLISDITDGILNAGELRTGLKIDVDATLDEKGLAADGMLNLDDLKYASYDFGKRSVKFGGTSEDLKHFDLYADTDEIPLSILSQFVDFGKTALDGEVVAKLTGRGALDSLELSGYVYPDDVTIYYAPYDARFALGNVPVHLENDIVRIADLPVFAVDSTRAVVDGTVDLSDLSMDFKLRSDRFKPLALTQNDSIPYFGNIAAALDARFAGVPDSLQFTADISLLPESEVYYYIDKKNHLYAKPTGNLKVLFPIGGDLTLDGRIDVKQGEIHYSPAYYPLEPFAIDPGSHLEFHGPLKNVDLNITATQSAKAIVGDTGDRTREVNFIVGVIASNSLDNLNLGFTVKAPHDDTIQKEIDGFTTEERDRIAVALLATGMYISETNTAMAQSGYAMTSILQRSANAFVSNKFGNVIDIDFGAGLSRRDGLASTDYSMTLSKSLFNDRLKVTVGGRISDTKGGAQKSQSAIDNLSLDWKVKKNSNTTLTSFHRKDYENVVDGELDKDGLGVRTSFNVTSEKDPDNPFNFDIEGNVSYRSNSQFGPDLSATMSKYNLLKLNEMFSAKIFGAYYFKTANRSSGHSYDNDNFDIGFETSATFDKLFFPKMANKDFSIPVSTSFNLGYMYENIASGRLLNKFSLGIDYGFRTSKYISHRFSPLTWTMVLSLGNDDYYRKNPNFDNLIKSIADNTNSLAIDYNFRYNNTFETARDVTTRFEAGVMESAILTNSLIKSMPFDEFLKFKFELRNRFLLSETSSLATRIFTGAAVPVAGSYGAPLAELFYIAGPNSIRAFAPRSIGPGEFHSDKYNLYMYHSGELKLEANAEYRFPLFWMLEGALFVDAGNVWNAKSVKDYLSPEELLELQKITGVIYNFDDGIKFDKFFRQLALGTGFGVRLAFQSIVVRLDLGIAIHAPYDTGKSGYYNIPNFFKDGTRLNFGIGYPF